MKEVLYWETHSKKIEVPDDCPTDTLHEMEDWYWEQNKELPDPIKEERMDCGIAEVEDVKN